MKHIYWIVIALAVLACPSAWADDLSRADYKIAIPAGSTVHKARNGVDENHYSSIHFPEGGFLSIIVVDDKEIAEKQFPKLLTDYKNLLKDSVESKTNTFDKAKATRSIKLGGTILGLKNFVELGEIQGEHKTFFMILFYAEDEQAADVELAAKALDTFVIKE